VNRALGPGWNVWAEHTDSLQERDTGWLQVYVSTVQEAYDATLLAFRIAEHPSVLLPVMVNLDASPSPISCSRSRPSMPGTSSRLSCSHAIDTKIPAVWYLTGPEEYFKFRWDIERSMRDASGVIQEAETEFAERFGRRYGFTDEYLCEDADVLIIALGTLAKRQKSR